MYRTLALAIAMIVSLPAAAQEPAQQAPLDPARRADVLKTLDQNFDRSDVNNDGFLSDEEVRATSARIGQQLGARLEQEFRTLDKDKNGQLSVEEFKAVAASRMAQMPASAMQQLDANKDGKVSAAEFNGPALAAFDRMDANKDGTISPEEKQAAARR